MLANENIHVLVRNISLSSISLPEINGYILNPDEEIDMMDDGRENAHYHEVDAVLRALNELIGTVLYQKSHAEPPELSYRIIKVG